MRIKGGKKIKRSGRKRTYYQTVQPMRTRANKRRRQAKREKQIAFFKENPEAGSPSQIKGRKNTKKYEH